MIAATGSTTETAGDSYISDTSSKSPCLLPCLDLLQNVMARLESSIRRSILTTSCVQHVDVGSHGPNVGGHPLAASTVGQRTRMARPGGKGVCSDLGLRACRVTYGSCISRRGASSVRGPDDRWWHREHQIRARRKQAKRLVILDNIPALPIAGHTSTRGRTR